MLVNIGGSFIPEGAVLYRYIIDPGGRSITVHYCPRQLCTGIILPPPRQESGEAVVYCYTTEGELTLWWRFDDELWTRFVYVVWSVFFLSWVIHINNDPVRQHDCSCSQTSHAKTCSGSETMF